MRTVWAVGSGRWWPPEVYVLFAAEREALRHAASAAYVFDVFALPVYGAYADCPAPLTLTDSSPAGLETAAEDVYALARAAADSASHAPGEDIAAPVYTVGAWETQGDPEVWALYERAEDAERHVSAAYYQLEARTLPVFWSYDDCPTDRRYAEPGPALSQLVVPRLDR